MTQNIFQWSSWEQMNNMHQVLNKHRQGLVEILHFNLFRGSVDNRKQTTTSSSSFNLDILENCKYSFYVKLSRMYVMSMFLQVCVSV